MVAAFYSFALAHGGNDNGAAGARPCHPGCCAAFVLDPDGNHIGAIFHSEADRGAASIRVAFPS